MKKRIAIIIPAHNEEAYLPDTLAAIGRQTYQDFDTIVVANACSDNTAAIAERSSRVIISEEPGQSRAQNVGARAARSHLLLFLDADVALHPRALELIVEQFTPDHAVGTFEARPSGTRHWHRALYAFRNFVHRVGLYRSHLGGIICRRELFLEIGGFDERWEPRSNRHLIRRLLRFGGFCYLEAPVTVSTRRYEAWGLRRLSSFWLIATLRSFSRKTRRTEYPVIR